jgi:hypothetical protein
VSLGQPDGADVKLPGAIDVHNLGTIGDFLLEKYRPIFQRQGDCLGFFISALV